MQCTVNIREEAARFIFERGLLNLFIKCFPTERLGWLVYEIQHPPINIHLQAMVCRREWLKYEGGLPNGVFSKQL